nr:formin-2-like [Aegilops tauschii subsp. strangulata]
MSAPVPGAAPPPLRLTASTRRASSPSSPRLAPDTRGAPRPTSPRGAPPSPVAGLPPRRPLRRRLLPCAGRPRPPPQLLPRASPPPLLFNAGEGLALPLPFLCSVPAAPLAPCAGIARLRPRPRVRLRSLRSPWPCTVDAVPDYALRAPLARLGRARPPRACARAPTPRRPIAPARTPSGRSVAAPARATAPARTLRRLRAGARRPHPITPVARTHYGPEGL